MAIENAHETGRRVHSGLSAWATFSRFARKQTMDDGRSLRLRADARARGGPWLAGTRDVAAARATGGNFSDRRGAGSSRIAARCSPGCAYSARAGHAPSGPDPNRTLDSTGPQARPGGGPGRERLP